MRTERAEHGVRPCSALDSGSGKNRGETRTRIKTAGIPALFCNSLAMQRVPRAGARRSEGRAALAREPVRKLKKTFRGMRCSGIAQEQMRKTAQIFLHPSAAASARVSARCIATTHDAGAASVRLAAFLTGTSRTRDGCIPLRRAAIAERERAFAAPPQQT